MSKAVAVLIVDDDADHAATTAEALERSGYKCTVATGGAEGLQQLRKGDFQIVVTDLVMKDADGFAVLRAARESLDAAEVVMLTGHGTVESAVKAMQEGAYSYLAKPVNLDELRTVVGKAYEKVQLALENRYLHSQIDARFGFEGIIGNSARMKEIFDKLSMVAPTDATVLVMGESGTGKELIAKAIHNNSPRRQKPFVVLHCAALAEGVLESELFGHERGAFTGATAARQGKFEYADGGTLFLDEVGDIPLAIQVKLLRVLENQEVTRVGSNKSTKVDVRIVSATNRDLEAMVKNGGFREDLYFRLKVVTIQTQPLRERKEDLPLLIASFIDEFNKKYKRGVQGISAGVRSALYQHAWPGNVRELRNVVESMVVVARKPLLQPEELPEYLQQKRASTETAIAPGITMQDMEKQLIAATLKATHGNRHEAAKMLEIGERTLYRKINEYNLR